jgi:uncharacterized protein with GYD domain
MPIYITQGRYTRDAIKGMIDKPEDRDDALSRAITKAGGRLIGYYVTFGEYDFLTICEAPGDVQMMATLPAPLRRPPTSHGVSSRQAACDR